MADVAPTLDELESKHGSEKFESPADTMRSVMEEMRDSADEGDRTTPGSEPKQTDEPSAEGEPSGERPRDPETGRFVAKEGSEGAKEGAEGAEPTQEATQEQPEGQEGTTEAEELEPPHDWNAAEQEAFRKLPSDARKFVLEREGAARDMYGKAFQAAQYYYNLEQLLAPRREAWYAAGTDEVGMIRQLLALSDRATHKPVDFAQMFVRDRGLKPEQVFPSLAQQQGGDADYADPEITNLRQQNAQLQERLDRLEGTYKSQEQQALTATQQQIMQQVQQFQSETDERGQPKRPYFAQVQGLMSNLIRSGAASDLDNAYDMAVHAHPDVRAKIAATQKAQSERERVRKDREKAEAARKAGSSVSGTPGDRARAEPTGDLREDLRSEFAARGLL